MPDTVTQGQVLSRDLFWPLSSASKRIAVVELQKKDSVLLRDALVNAAIEPCHFPEPLYSKLIHLQQAYQDHDDDPDMQMSIKGSIEKYIDKNGLTIFIDLLKQEINPNNWKSHFINFITKSLDIEFNPDPIVEMALSQGKIYWHIIGHGELGIKVPGERFDYSQANSIRMTWHYFRLFKDTGKRPGSVAITKKRFIDCFEEAKKSQAAAVWQELMEKGILNRRKRLSDSWRVLSDVKIILDSIKNASQDFTTWQDAIKKYLKNAKANKTIITREVFKKENASIFSEATAGFIWDRLKKFRLIDDNNKVCNLSGSIMNCLKDTLITYKEVNDAIYAITNNEDYAESIQAIPNAKIFRPERSSKTWCETGKIQNNDPGNTSGTKGAYLTKLWDVSIYGDLEKHIPKGGSIYSYTNKEGNKEIAGLHKDHIPSKIELVEKAKVLINDIKSNTQLSAEEVAKLDAIENEIEKSTAKDFLGPLWWVIAIPAELHKEGETYLKSLKNQQKSSKGIFLKEVGAYLDILEKRADEFGLPEIQFLKALGAFRYLFSRLVKTPEMINGQYSIGLTPQSFFKNVDTNKQIDAMFTERAKRFIAIREGFEPKVFKAR